MVEHVQEGGVSPSITTPKTSYAPSSKSWTTQRPGRHRRHRKHSVSGSSTNNPLLYSDTPFKKNKENKALHTYKESLIFETPCPSRQSNNGILDSTLREHVTFTGPSSIVQTLKNAAGVHSHTGSAYPKTTSTSLKKLLFTTGNGTSSLSWEDSRADER